MTRQAVLAERRELFDRFYDTKLRAKIEKRLEEMIENGAGREAIKAIEIAMKYGLGVPTEREDPKPAPIFNFLVQGADGSVRPLALPAPQVTVKPAEEPIEAEFRELDG